MNRSFTRYLASSKIALRERLLYPKLLIAEAFSVIARFGVLVLLYKAAFDYNGGTLEGYGFQVTIWSLFFYFVIMVSKQSDISRDISNDVTTGELELMIARPFHYIGHKLMWRFGYGIYISLVTLMVGGGILALLIGLPETFKDIWFCIGLVSGIVGGVILGSIVFVPIGLSAFIIQDAGPLRWIVTKLNMILGGAFVPIAFFPPLIQEISLYSPFGITHMVTRLPYNTSMSQVIRLVELQVIWIIVLGLFSLWLYNKIRLRLEINGG